MDPDVESALIGAAAALIGVGGTVIVAIIGARNTRRTNQATINVARDDAQRMLDTTREAQYADRYSRAIEQLGSLTLDIRIGGMYALEGIATDAPRYHPTVMEVLTTFIREHSRAPSGDRPERWPLPDIQTALTVIGRRNTGHDTRSLDLVGADLTHADLTHAGMACADLTHADLTHADLTHAGMACAKLARADLTHADLTHAGMACAKLARADLTDSDLADAKLIGADLTNAKLTGADLTDAALTGAELSHAKLTEAKLTSASLGCADLTAAKLANADLTSASLVGADLTEANLTDADLTRAELSGADLSGANLAGAVPPNDTRLPEGWKLDGDGRLDRKTGH